MSVGTIKLGDALNLYNGKAPVLSENGEVTVFGSNGVIGKSEKANHPRSIILGRVGAYCGAVKFSDEPFWASDNTIVVRPVEGHDLKYWYYKLQSIPLRGYAGGAAQPLITHSIIKPLETQVHDDVAVQQRIASVLSAYDDLIENNLRRIAALEEAARLLYREWFVYFRFPGHEHIEIVEGVPEGWEQLALEELLVLQRGFDLPVASRNDGNVPVYGSTGIVGYHDVAKVKAPMLITGRSGSLGKVVFVSIPCWPLNTALWVKEFRRISPWFGYFLLSELGLEKFNGGASVPTLDRKVVHRLSVARPTDQLLNSFDEQVKPSFEIMDKLNQQNEQLAKARNLLLPRLMDGRIEI